MLSPLNYLAFETKVEKLVTEKRKELKLVVSVVTINSNSYPEICDQEEHFLQI